MIASQTFRIAGIRAQLGIRGHTLHLEPDGPDLPALLQPAGNDQSEYQLSEETTVTDIVNILAEDLGATVIQPGSILTEGSVQYRVVKVDEHPVDVLRRFYCEATRL